MIRLLILIFSVSMFAQSRGQLIFGGSAGFGINFYSASFDQLEGFPNCCTGFDTGSGSGFNLNIFGKYQYRDNLYFGAKLGIMDLSGQYSISDATRVRVSNLEIVDGEFNHILTPSLMNFYIEPHATYFFTKELSLSLGLPVGSFISSNFTQQENLVKPDNTGAFYNEETGEILGRIRNARSGQIPNTSFQFGLALGVEYNFKLNDKKTMYFGPTVNLVYNLSEVSKGTSWNTMQFSAGLSFNYKPKKAIEAYRKIINIDTVDKVEDYIANNYFILGKSKITSKTKISKDTIFTIEEFYRTDTLVVQGKEPIIDYADKSNTKVYKKLVGDLQLIGADYDGNEVDFNQIDVKVELTREIYPLLPFVFFEENSALIPDRYVRVDNANEFRESKIPPSALNYHRNNLNIIGKRLQKNTASKISVQGFVDPKTEPDNCELAVRRAIAIKAYLIKVYGIEKDRIQILADNNNCYPKDITRTESQKGFQENRRVQISTDDFNLLFAVSNAQYQEPKFVLPQTILMNIKANQIEATHPIEIDKPYPIASDLNYLPADNWELFVNQSGRRLYEHSEYAQQAQLTFEIDRFNAASLTENNLDFELIVLNNKDGSETITKSIPVSKDTLPYEVDRLTLAVFEVSSAAVTSKIKREIQRFIKISDKNSQVNIIGYSDDIGNEYENLKLSRKRAENIKNYIKQIAPRTKFGRVEGVGSSEFSPGLKSYDSPEERFISRTVEIEIRKQIK